MVDTDRRAFLRGRAAAPTHPRPRPPWALRSDAEFATRCTRCGDCIRSCAAGVLQPGDGGFPEIRFDQRGCTLCGDCAHVCASGALDRQAVAEPFAWRVEVAANCLLLQGVECRACGDPCDTQALRFVPARGGIPRLRLDSAACTGCGQCVPVCPVRAIGLSTRNLPPPSV